MNQIAISAVFTGVVFAAVTGCTTNTDGADDAEAEAMSMAGASGYSSSFFTITFNPSVTDEEAEAIQSTLGPTGQRLYCNEPYSWYDSNGVFALQHQCRGTTAPWGFHIAAALQPFVAGPISERGMSWAKNGITQPRMAPHKVTAPNYQFHGTFSGSPDGTKITYDDHFRFRHSIGPGGDADIHIWGSFTLTGNPPPPPAPCRTGRPC